MNFLVSGRLYGLKNDGATLFPRIDGAPEFVHLTKERMKAIQLVKTVSPNKLQVAIKGTGISAAAIKFAENFAKKY